MSCNKAGLPGIGIRDGQRTAVSQNRRGRVFGNASLIITCNGGRIIDAGDGDGNIMGGAISTGHGDGIGQRGPCAQCLDRRLAVSGGIRPVAGCSDA